MDKKTKENLSSVIHEFIIEEKCTRISAFGSGHINDSFLIETDNSFKSYFLQRINHHIFKDIPGLMQNILRVTRHLEEKVLSGDPAASGWSTLRLLQERAGGYFHLDKDGNYWRLYNYIGDTKSYDQVNDALLAHEGGKAFGRFQYLATDLPTETLIETIPGFHNLDKRLSALRNVIAKNPENRVKQVEREIGFVDQRCEEMKILPLLIIEGKTPQRVTHNDTKFNNVLFNASRKAVCIVDLDTVMPGTILYDFGDAIRTGANSGREDEKDLTKVNIDLGLFKAYSEGYLDIAQNFLNSVEFENLAFSAKFMTFIIGVRFLTDHIAGDHYFRIHFENHNLQRARAQFKLLESMEQNFGTMKKIIEQIVE